MTVLAYPPITEKSFPAALPPRRFAAQLDLLADMGLPVIPLAVAVSQTGPGIAVTFDGGHRQLYTLAYPLLASRGLVATVYMMTGHISSLDPLPDGGQAMSWAMLRELSQAGWTIGSQGVRATRLTTLAEGTLAEELRASRKALEDGLGTPCPHFCPPWGDMDQRVLTAIRAAGYMTAALTLTRRHPLRAVPGIVARVGISRETGWWRFRLKVRGWALESSRRAPGPPETLSPGR
ncbi:MAG: polysaccharide deacetylase family protein [Acidobacteria bacterium]|nr:polysaccharide deacetylase family protein [Acidobacteriota bacterium]